MSEYRLARDAYADEEGFYVARASSPHEAAEELSALSADLASLHAGHMGLLRNKLRVLSQAWSIVDAAGNTELGVWPLFIGPHRFSLVVSGAPCFNQWPFSELVWALSRRYLGR